MALAFLRGFASSQGCSVMEALSMCKRKPRLFDAGIYDALNRPQEKPNGKQSGKRIGETFKGYKARLEKRLKQNAERVSHKRKRGVRRVHRNDIRPERASGVS